MALAKDSLQRVPLRWPDSEVVFDDDFTTEPGNLHGWASLYSGEWNGVVGYDGGGMVLCLENTQSQIATAIKRISFHQRWRYQRLEMWYSHTPWYTANSNGDPKTNSIEFGFDTADNDGNRTYYGDRVRHLEGDGTTVIRRGELKTGTAGVPSWTPLPGQGYATDPLGASSPAPTWSGKAPMLPILIPNEGKKNRIYRAIDVDMQHAVYRGSQFNDRGFGSLADAAQRLMISGAPTGGTFRLTFKGQQTSALAFNASASDVRAALEALSTIGAGNVMVFGGPTNGYTIDFLGDLAKASQPTMTVTASLTGGTSPDATITPPVTDLSMFSGQTNSLPRFGNGDNAAIDYRAISAGSQAGGTVRVYRVRMTGYNA